MQVSPLSWQSLTFHHSFPTSFRPTRFFDFQTETQQALSQFLAEDFGALLLLKSETLPEFLAEIRQFLAENQADCVVLNEFTRYELCGYRLYLEKSGQVETVFGAIQHAQKKVLLLNIKALLTDIAQWDKLKHALLFGQYQPYAQNALPHAEPSLESRFKLILLGNREEIATLQAYDDALFEIARYAEVESYLNVAENLTRWADYVQTGAQRYLGKSLSNRALNQLLHALIRQSESRDLVSISPTWLARHLNGIAHFYAKPTAYKDIGDYFSTLEQQSAPLHRYALQDILNRQIQLETEGEIIGQINGLSVVEFDGVPYAFGEPLRISCNVQLGDGEIHDIEHKVELGGNIHAKGILLAQSCLVNLLELPSQLPFSATVAFEQSYGEIDGDSSSLAIFCALVSALSKVPVPQSFAVTGAIDQFGNVLSVGGVNQKIEGFFDVCEARGLSGNEAVIIPAVCLSHLSLKTSVVNAVKAGKFRIWAVEDVFEALSLLLAHDFFNDEDDEKQNEKPTLFELIQENLEQKDESASGRFWQTLRKWLNFG